MEGEKAPALAPQGLCTCVPPDAIHRTTQEVLGGRTTPQGGGVARATGVRQAEAACTEAAGRISATLRSHRIRCPDKAWPLLPARAKEPSAERWWPRDACGCSHGDQQRPGKSRAASPPPQAGARPPQVAHGHHGGQSRAVPSSLKSWHAALAEGLGRDSSLGPTSPEERPVAGRWQPAGAGGQDPGTGERRVLRGAGARAPGPRAPLEKVAYTGGPPLPPAQLADVRRRAGQGRTAAPARREPTCPSALHSWCEPLASGLLGVQGSCRSASHHGLSWAEERSRGIFTDGKTSYQMSPSSSRSPPRSPSGTSQGPCSPAGVLELSHVTAQGKSRAL